MIDFLPNDVIISDLYDIFFLSAYSSTTIVKEAILLDAAVTK